MSEPLWSDERIRKEAMSDEYAIGLGVTIRDDYEAQLSNQYQRIERFVELVDQLERKLAEATEANTSCTRYIADQEIRIANLEHLLGDEDDDEDKPYYDTPGGF